MYEKMSCPGVHTWMAHIGHAVYIDVMIRQLIRCMVHVVMNLNVQPLHDKFLLTALFVCLAFLKADF